MKSGFTLFCCILPKDKSMAKWNATLHFYLKSLGKLNVFIIFLSPTYFISILRLVYLMYRSSSSRCANSIDSHRVSSQLLKMSFCLLANIGVSKSIGESHFWICSYFTSSAQQVLFILLGWFVRWKVSGRTAAVLWSSASRICSKQHTASLCSSHFFFFFLFL